MTDWVVAPATRPLRGVVRVPSDKSIGHRAVILAALANGTSTLRRFSFGEDNVATVRAFEKMGVAHEVRERGAHAGALVVHGVGLFGLRPPIDGVALDCGNSGTTMRLLAGLLSAQEFGSTLIGDPSLSRRPMRRVLEPLRARGAHCRGVAHPTRDDETAPIRIAPLLPAEGERLAAAEVDLAVASAQVKSALLLSGLYAHGPTLVREPTLSRDHTERMLVAAGVPLRAVGSIVVLDPAGWNGEIAAFDVAIPGDLSSAAFVVVAANIVAGSAVRIVDVGVNPTRTGVLDVLRAMRAGAEVVPKGERGGEPVATLETGAAVDEAGSGMSSTSIGGELVPRAIDEIPVLCVAAACAAGTTVVRDARELRVKESDRIATIAEVLRAFGVEARELDDGLEIVGKPHGKLRAAEVVSRGDHRIAMSAAVLALRADAPSRIGGVDCVATSFPGFARTLRDLGVDLREE